jgi:hypothetical protein
VGQKNKGSVDISFDLCGYFIQQAQGYQTPAVFVSDLWRFEADVKETSKNIQQTFRVINL